MTLFFYLCFSRYCLHALSARICNEDGQDTSISMRLMHEECTLIPPFCSLQEPIQESIGEDEFLFAEDKFDVDESVVPIEAHHRSFTELLVEDG